MCPIYYTDMLLFMQWSYGIVLWEIFTYGEQPYEGLENTEIGKYLKEGRRLERPPLAPELM